MKAKRKPASGNSQKHKMPQAWRSKATPGGRKYKARTARRSKP